MKKQLELKEAEIEKLKTQKNQSFMKKQDEINIIKDIKPRIFSVNEEFISRLKDFTLPVNYKVSDFFDEIYLQTKEILKNSSEKNENLRNWCSKFQEFYSNYMYFFNIFQILFTNHFYY